MKAREGARKSGDRHPLKTQLAAKAAATIVRWALCAFASEPGYAQDTTIHAEQEKLIKAGAFEAALGPRLFGDNVNDYTGSLQFTQTDIDLPGNDKLPVKLTRKYALGAGPLKTGNFGDWDIDLPYIGGTFAIGGSRTGANYGFAVSGFNANAYKRCSMFGEPPDGNPNKGLSIWAASEYWSGTSLHNPGEGAKEILIRSPQNSEQPSDGYNYPLVTQSGWQIRCLTSLHPRNVLKSTYYQGEGFFAIAPNGLRYKFDWMIHRGAMSLTKRSYLGTDRLFRADFFIYPTEISDKHGNFVRFTFNPSNPQQLTRIEASDGRRIDIAYADGTN